MGQGLSASSSLEDALTCHYEVLGDIGQGSFATVKLAQHILTGTEVAVKVLPKIEQDLPFIVSEVDIMKAMEHPHVVQLFEVIETFGAVYIVMEYAGGGPLSQHIPEAVGLQEEEARRMFRQIVSAVCHCHTKGIVHRDLKLGNVLVGAGGNVKLCDFNLSHRFTAGQKFHRLCGTPSYWAPELYQCQEYDGPAVDVWSLGVLLYHMVTGRFPFDGTSFKQLRKQVLHARYDIPAHMSPEVQSLIAQMLTMDPTQRPTVDQILRHPWLSQGEECTPSPWRDPLLDPSIMEVMLDLGYSLSETWMSLKTRKFDAAMATYLMLQYQKTWGAGCLVPPRPVRLEAGPRPCPSVPSTVAVHPKRSASVPALCSTLFLPGEQQLPVVDKPSGLKDRRASEPAIPPCSSQAGTPVPSLTARLPSSWSSSSMWEGESCTQSQLVSSEESSVSLGTPPGDPADQAPHDHSEGWRGLSRRIATCMARVCCCVPAPKTGLPNQVAPTHRGQTGGRFENKVALMDSDS
ncbi:sperm motility kinase 3A-like [Sciurus carolinensis]|uniref:sperm motility kinase 3A-like n=1 Tax=Sciurus carolinensis TaxID=30640 RepID=UPI001FB1C8AA|nr:sperm motility kinase 3A-like [Sciurus carolinensis]